MPWSLDSEIASAVVRIFEAAGPVEPPPRGDVATRRSNFDALQVVVHPLIPPSVDVEMTDFEATTEDGVPIMMRWYALPGSSTGSAVLYVHGGGMILGNVGMYDRIVARSVATTGVPFLSVEYRYAPEHPAPTPVTDSYAAFLWLVAHADDLSVDPTRIAIMGDSAGGGVAASTAIYARDKQGPAFSRQILIYPMLDDRNTMPDPDPELAPFLTWSYDDNATGWGALLGDRVGGADISPYGAAARLDDFRNLPPAYLEVGELDIFRDEVLSFAQSLVSAGVSTEFHLRPTVPHAFDMLAPEAAVSRRAIADRDRVIRAL